MVDSCLSRKVDLHKSLSVDLINHDMTVAVCTATARLRNPMASLVCPGFFFKKVLLMAMTRLYKSTHEDVTTRE